MLTTTIVRMALGLVLCTAATPGLSATQVIDRITCDGSRCPEPLELVNGETVTVTLYGEYLDQLVSGMVSVGTIRPLEISEVSVELVRILTRLTRSLTTRTATLTAQGAAERSGLDLRFATSDGRSVRAPLQVAVAADPVIAVAQPIVAVAPDQVTRLQGDDLFRPAFENTLGGVMALFSSCGSPDQHRFIVNAPLAGYSATGGMPRFERTIRFMSGDWVAFGEDHTLDPSDVVTGELADIPNSAHPSPIAHSVSHVRICLVSAASRPWTFVRGEMRDGAPHLLAVATFDRLLFKARGMPAHPTGVSGEAVIRWGTVITDAELPDYEWRAPVYRILLPLEVSGGRITYGAPGREAATRSSAGWSSQFLGPSGLRDRMVNYTRDRVEQIGDEILKTFAAPATRDAISRLIMSGLQSEHGITEVLSVKLAGDTWEVYHR